MKFKVTEDKLFLRLVEWEDTIQIHQLQISLTKKIDGYYYKIKKFKKFGWTGDICFFDKNFRIPIGLWGKVCEICDQYKYQYEIEGLETIIDQNFDENNFREWMDNYFKKLDHPIVKYPYDYQIESAIEILKWRRSVIEVATSGGKTLILFMVFAYLKHINYLKKMLVIVPRIDLVLQTIEKFEMYSKEQELIKYKMQAIGGGFDKSKKDVDIIVGTYQTLTNLPEEFYEDINIVCDDECHTAQSKSVSETIKKCKNAHFRFGLSGTTKIDAENAGAYTILGLFGPLVKKVTADYLFQNKHATPVKIKMIYLDYLDQEKKHALYELRKDDNIDNSKVLAYEKKIIRDSQERFDFLINLVSKVTDNSLILFSSVGADYGVNIMNKLKQILNENFEIFYIDGSIDKDDRETYRQEMNKTDKIRVMIASYQVFSTGIDINNIHNIFLVESYKSEVIIKQSVGRGMRLMGGKNYVTVIDLIDDFQFGNSKNFIMKHAEERKKIYINEKYIIKEYKIKF